MNHTTLEPEDYQEPRCLLCGNPAQEAQPERLPMDRITEKLDAYFHVQDYTGAERHLRYWLEEARNGRDLRGEFSMRNEMMGFYRKLGRKADALDCAEEALALIDRADLGGTVSAGTCFVNAATVYDAFDLPEQSLPLFVRAQEIYEQYLTPGDSRLGGLYNNMALACVALRRFRDAETYNEKALSVMRQVPNGEAEQAITYLNMADAAVAELGEEAAEQKVWNNLDLAAELLDTPSLPHGGYYAYVCEKCAPVFAYYGYFQYANELKERVSKINERT